MSTSTNRSPRWPSSGRWSCEVCRTDTFFMSDGSRVPHECFGQHWSHDARLRRTCVLEKQTNFPNGPSRTGIRLSNASYSCDGYSSERAEVPHEQGAFARSLWPSDTRTPRSHGSVPRDRWKMIVEPNHRPRHTQRFLFNVREGQTPPMRRVVRRSECRKAPPPNRRSLREEYCVGDFPFSA